MFPLTANQCYYLYREPTDMRKSFNGLSGLVKNELQLNPLDGAIYIFINRRRNRVKLLVWDRTGFVIYYKRLEQGTFELPQMEATALSCTLNWDQLICILEGVALESIKRRKRFSRV